MRKLFLILLTVFIIALAMPRVRAAETAMPISNADLFSRLLKNVGVDDPSYRLTWDDLFGADDEDFGQNLYLQMYQTAVLEPEETVLTGLAQKYGLTIAEARQVSRGVLTPLFRTKKVKPGFTQEEATELLNQLQTEYRESLDMQNLTKELEAELTPSEIFANDDTSDSGFDLIADLTEIEKILFEKTSDGTINKIYQASPLPTEEKPGPLKTIPSGVQQETATGPYEGTFPGGTKNGSETETSSAPLASENLSENPEVCLTDAPLTQAIQKYENTEEKKKSGGESSFDETAGGLQYGGSSQNGDSGNFSETAENISFPTAAKAGDFTQNPLCPEGEPYCVEVKLIKGAPLIPFVPADESIKTQSEAIRNTLKKTVDQSLLPHKVTGNIFESALCKASLKLPVLVNSRIIAIGQPIRTPINDDAFFGSHITDEFMKFWWRYSPFYTPKKGQKAGVRDSKEPSSDRQSLFDRAFTIALLERNEETLQTEIIEKVDQYVSQALREARQNVENFPIETRAENVADEWKQLSYEMDEMLAHFQSFKTIFTAIAEKTCPVIQDKKICE